MSAPNSQFDFSEGFTHENDILNRYGFYKNLLKLIKNSPEEGMVIALDDRWGQGKTSLVKMMHGEIKSRNKEHEDCSSDEYLEKNINSIYFDAYENDHHSDAFIPICAEFYSLLNNHESKLKNLRGVFLKSATRVGVAALTGGVKAVISASTGGLINGNTFAEGAVEGVKSTSLEFTDSIAKHVETKITSAKEERQDIDNFRKTLSEIHTDTSQKTIFIIDELDRAKPDFSLDLLEKIKHLFSVKNVIFILVMNRGQFEKCIEKRYGGIDSKTYLNKFINYFVSLPKSRLADTSIYDLHTKTTIYNYFKKIPEAGKLFNYDEHIHIGLSYLIEINGCSLREAERCISLMSIFSNGTDKLNYNLSFSAALVVMTFLKVFDSTLYNNFISKDFNASFILNKLHLDKEPDLSSSVSLVHKEICKMITFHYFTRSYIEANPAIINTDYNALCGQHGHAVNPFMGFKDIFENFSFE